MNTTFTVKNSKNPKSVDRMIENHKTEITIEARKKGQQVARNNPPTGKDNISEIPTVRGFLGKTSALLTDISGSIEPKLQGTYTKFRQGKNELIQSNFVQSHRNKITELAVSKKAEKQAVEIAIQEEKENNETDITQTEKRVRMNESRLADYPFKNVFWSVILSVLFTVGILTSEVFTNQKAFLFLKGESYLSSLVIALGISFITFLLGFATSYVIQHKKITDQLRTALIIGLSLIALGVFWGVAELRTTMMESMNAGADGRAGFIISKTTLILINLGFYVALIIVKLLLFPKPEVFANNRTHKKIKSEINKGKKQVKTLKSAQKHLPKKERDTKANIDKSYAKKEEEVTKELEAERKKLKQYEVEYNQTLSIGINIYKQLNEVCLESIGTFVEQINLYSDNPEVLSFSKTDIPPLVNPFEAYDYISEYEVETVFNV